MKYLLKGESSERLDFRMVTQADYNDWMPFFKDTAVATFLALDPKMTSKELCDFWFEKVFNRYENNMGGMNALIDKLTGKMVGQAGLLVQTVEGETVLEIGYSLLPEYWGKGYAFEAANKLKTHAFEKGYASELVSIIHPDNEPSKRVAIKNGMTLLKTVAEYNGIPAEVYQVKK